MSKDKKEKQSMSSTEFENLKIDYSLLSPAFTDFLKEKLQEGYKSYKEHKMDPQEILVKPLTLEFRRVFETLNAGDEPENVDKAARLWWENSRKEECRGHLLRYFLIDHSFDDLFIDSKLKTNKGYYSLFSPSSQYPTREQFEYTKLDYSLLSPAFTDFLKEKLQEGYKFYKEDKLDPNEILIKPLSPEFRRVFETLNAGDEPENVDKAARLWWENSYREECRGNLLKSFEKNHSYEDVFTEDKGLQSSI